MQITDYLLKGIEYILLGYFAMASIYVFVFSIAGHFYKKRRKPNSKNQNRIAILIPAYKEDTVIIEVAASALDQMYPSKKFDVVVIADSLKKNTITKLKTLPIILIEVFFEKSTKSKALNKAMESLDKPYDYALVLDADNIMEPYFLEKINDAFERGYQIVQGHRKAKNLNTSFAILDGASEEINNHIFRQGHRVLGLSSGLIGSGMGFDYELFKSVMRTVKAVGGFDKELEFNFAKNRIAIEYLQDAVVLDEKVKNSSDFTNQRKRWLSTQFVFLKKNFVIGWKELFLKGNINFFDKVWQLIIPPRILLLGFTFLVALVYSIIQFNLGIEPNVSVYFWHVNLIVTAFAYLLAIPKTFYNKRTLKATLSIPYTFLSMALLLFKLKGANKNFIHTPHGSTPEN
jgi:cellulose synthase/poly-beta-1,6-N-acetylglucosamine synthase-like glycosyltransferase